ncbi:MAG: NADPH:quinone oxidoreductase family protein [Pseudomonadota bacterium]|jgi:NADPH:quinone reductase
MKAMLCKALGLPETLVYEELPDLRPGPGQVVIDVHACGVNFPDYLIIQGKYQTKPKLPFSPGGEVAGVVNSVGEGVSNVAPGDRVLCFIGTGYGGYADQALVKAEMVTKIPPQMDFVTASAFLLTYGTSYYSLKDRGDLKPGETLVVLGAAGGVGLAAVELGKAMGARVIAAASSDEKLAVCKEHGADAVINYATEDLKERIKELTGGKGADVIYDPVGGDYSEAALRAIGWGGRFLVVGFANGEIPKIPLNLTLLKSCQIVGVFWGASIERDVSHFQRRNDELLQYYVEGKLKPLVSGVYPLEEAARAINYLVARKVTGKLALLTGRS